MNKKIIVALSLIWVGSQAIAQNVPEKYLREMDKISNTYTTDMRQFLRSLPNSTVQFNPQQKNQYCSIVAIYVDDFYQLIDQNRASLPFSYTNMTKQDVIVQVKKSKEMQLLSRYHIECDLNQVK
ncbi:hypothetical protein [Acinetobacter sp. TGL-Y2]|uniref:hypothetical protein n=1 Tax=Acinetobacter sp. TGL-Y2 TaxID=1407071 RepID=UPI001D17849B|nr:hypothetical protein [Acinetobacter sp. TGL-Y2]